MQTQARYKGRCLTCRKRIKRGDVIHHIPAPRKQRGKKPRPGKTFCRTCVAKVHRLRFPPAPDGKISAWLRAQELEMVERELARTTSLPSARRIYLMPKNG
jgi:hypothetical protein